MSRLIVVLLLVALPSLALAGGKPAPKAKASAAAKASAVGVGQVAVEGDDVDVPPGVSSFAFGECSTVGTAGWSSFGAGVGGQNKLCELVMAMKVMEATGMHRVPCDPKATSVCAYSPEYLTLARKAQDVATARTGGLYEWLRKVPILAWFL
jgi:hypothetical protein